MDSDSDSTDERPAVVRNASDLQRMKLEKLMKNIDKSAFVPDKPKDKRFPEPPEFVRNVMGSSAGAGSGEFHVYRHIRRREYARQEYLQHQKDHLNLDEEYERKLEENKKRAEEKTAKKRKKRQRQKEKLKAKKQMLASGQKKEDSSSEGGGNSGSEDEQAVSLEVVNSEKVETSKDHIREKLNSLKEKLDR